MRSARQSFQPIARTSILPSSRALAARSYSTSPNQQQVLQSFGTPFAQFIYTISRIARIITFSALGVATIGVVSFEAAHQYVEHVAMPAASSSSRTTSDEYGWGELALEESWSGSPTRTGTDPRLGIKGRHAVRSAWMSANWGGGISPSVLLGGGAAGNSGLGRTAITSMGAAKTLQVEDGMILAMQYLNLAVKIAASKGIKLPDTDSIRAGFVGEAAAKEQLRNVDPLAMALEARLASVKERQGSRGALESAIASYEKLYDIGSLTNEGRSENASRLVRLATKVGDLYSALGQRGDAEEWLNRAVSIAATAGASTPEMQGKQIEEVPAEEPQKASSGGWFSRSKAPAAAKAATPTEAVAAAPPTPTLGSDAAPTPALTRSLITALVSKSALHAHTPTPTSLQQALQTQMSALQLSTAELNRLVATPASSGPAELHRLWLTHHQSILDLHVAETMFALTRGAVSGTASKLIPAWFRGESSTGRVGEKSIAWVDQAEKRAEGVIKALEKSGKRGKDEMVLDERWTREKEVALAAGRVLRDAKRVKETARRSRSTLEGL
uniref:Uncharacterized protein n=2 Tax=Kalmanozyma brasiliensis (strain GHG001) TaxID=1365824 RepID=V5ESZ9_KALBG